MCSDLDQRPSSVLCHMYTGAVGSPRSIGDSSPATPAAPPNFDVGGHLPTPLPTTVPRPGSRSRSPAASGSTNRSRHRSSACACVLRCRTRRRSPRQLDGSPAAFEGDVDSSPAALSVEGTRRDRAHCNLASTVRRHNPLAMGNAAAASHGIPAPQPVSGTASINDPSAAEPMSTPMPPSDAMNPK